jgi:hypothetical protein
MTLAALNENVNDEEIISALESGVMEWTPGVTERLLQKIQSAVEARLHYITKSLQRDLGKAAGNMELVVTALLAARGRFVFVLRLAHLKALPTNIGSHLVTSIHSCAASIQESLEDSAREDRSGRLKSVIAKNPVLPSKAITPPPKLDHAAPNSTPIKRTIIK